MRYIPDQGELVWLDFDPSGGKEIMKRRPAFVISRKMFNEHTGMAIVAPVTSAIRGIKLEVILPKTLPIAGSILIHQLKSLDYQHRNIEFIAKAPKDVIEQVALLAQIILR